MLLVISVMPKDSVYKVFQSYGYIMRYNRYMLHIYFLMYLPDYCLYMDAEVMNTIGAKRLA